MPVSELLVEGKLDAELINAVLRGSPLVTRGGSKTSLKPKVAEKRKHALAVAVAYIRDRDFDLEPPADRSRPAVHSTAPDSTVLGWHWCRHEMENYLLEPALVARATGADEAGYRAALLEASDRLQHYQAARGAIGIIRRNLPPSFDFHTRPDDIPDDPPRVPSDLGAGAMLAWVCGHAQRFHDRACPELAPDAVERHVGARHALLSAQVLGSVDEVLVWFSGKDLLAALEPWRDAHGLGYAGDLRTKLRDWFLADANEALALLPEWQAFVAMVR